MLFIITDWITSGGILLLPIFLISSTGWILFFRIYRRITLENKAGEKIIIQAENMIEKNNNRQLFLLTQKTSCLISDLILLVIRHNRKKESVIESSCREKMIHYLPGYLNAIKTISFFAYLSPLLGLLGTVSGMTQTFNSITLYGYSDPALLSRGISTALITTQAGLITSFPLLLLNTRLKSHFRKLKKRLDYMYQKLVLYYVENSEAQTGETEPDGGGYETQ